MSDEARVQQLLDEIYDSNRTPEEVCADCPELLPEVRKRRRQMRLLEAHLDVLFPTPTPDQGANTPTPWNPAGELPDIPGYRVAAVIGRGGMGIVYKALHLRLNRTVALKMLLAGAYASRVERQRFLREAEAVAGLRHANIVQVYDLGEHDGRPYFTMELVEGGSLQAKVAGTPQPAAWAASLVATLAGAVHIAHQSGIVHRDLKPANVLLKADGTPKVTDFGLARRLEDAEGLTLSGALVGTPSYMAPEQARSDKSAIGPATDVYALGAILYELLTGRPPFRAESPTATLQQVVAEEPAPPTQLNSRVPRDLETICLKCLQKGPSERYASAAALADDLRRFERGEPITARPPGALERAAKWARRRPTAAALLAAALLMLGGMTAAAVWYASDRAQRHAEAQSRGLVANAALNDAEMHLKDLRAKLDHAPQAWDLLSDIEHWQSMVEHAREDWQRAVAAVGNELLVAQESRDRIQAVDATLAREEAAYGLARELDNIAVEALGSYDSRASQQRKAVAEYEHLFAGQGLDIRQPGTDSFVSAIQSSPARCALIAALDNWAWLADFIKQPQQLARLLELARAADPDPWRDRLRNRAVRADREALMRLAEETDVGGQSPTVLASLGVLLTFNGADPTALFARALLEHPQDFWLNLHAAMNAGKDPGLQGGLAQAALAIRPKTALAYMTLGYSLLQRRNWAAALLAANRTIKLKPNYTVGYIQVGLARRETNDLPGAVAAFKKAAELDPQLSDPYCLLGEVFLLQGDWGAAADSYRKGTDRACTFAVYWKEGGRTPRLTDQLRKLKHQPKAIAVFQKATELDPGDFLSCYILGQVFEQQGRHVDAEQAYLRAIKAQPAFVPAHGWLAWLLATCSDDKARDGKRAVKYATTACELTGWNDPLCLDTLAAAYAEAGRFDEAVRFQTSALEVDDLWLRRDFRKAATERLKLYRQHKPFRDEGP
jgi:serine/threonine-protein kinase